MESDATYEVADRRPPPAGHTQWTDAAFQQSVTQDEEASQATDVTAVPDEIADSRNIRSNVAVSVPPSQDVDDATDSQSTVSTTASWSRHTPAHNAFAHTGFKTSHTTDDVLRKERRQLSRSVAKDRRNSFLERQRSADFSDDSDN